ncbi:hypothetical protein AB0M23_28485 [Streptomyces sp. NPDC052077]|uniref:hypothetical protein n=1 Tax=Streptomyces sp. NPDC052077 TaxID=3154757 RepID=UPI00343DF349
MTGNEPGPAEAYRQAVRELYYEAARYPLGPLPDGAQEVWAQLSGTTEWQHVGYTTEPVPGISHGAPDPAGTAAVARPYRYGKSAALTNGTRMRSPLSDVLAAGRHQAVLERRLARLADDLGQWEPHVRHDFRTVQQVLEDHGIGDGRLTIHQPVRPPAWPSVCTCTTAWSSADGSRSAASPLPPRPQRT